MNIRSPGPLAAGLAFFDRHLLSRETPGDPLGSKDAAWAWFCKEEEAGKPVEWGRERAAYLFFGTTSTSSRFTTHESASASRTPSWSTSAILLSL